MPKREDWPMFDLDTFIADCRAALAADRSHGFVREVNVATLEAPGQSGTTVLHEMDLDAGVTPSVARQETGEQIFDDLRGSAHPQQSCPSGLESVGSFPQRIRVRQ